MMTLELQQYMLTTPIVRLGGHHELDAVAFIAQSRCIFRGKRQHIQRVWAGHRQPGKRLWRITDIEEET